jgi:hypothetical protein
MKVIRVYETVFQSVVSDFVTFSILFSLWYLNHRFCGGAWIIDLCVALFVIIGAVGKQQKRYDVKSAVDFLQSEEARQYINEGVKTQPATAAIRKPETPPASEAMNRTDNRCDKCPIQARCVLEPERPPCAAQAQVPVPMECSVCPLISVCDRARWYPDPSSKNNRGSPECLHVWARLQDHFGRGE